ncbi:hypothetical protein SBA4_3410012 [Candidatus Sulfopaludibacter sp. SbA4]|nr:hypothetical protein SBA4_3410012 [Candidatus Sulfopaludibacter sp. SbA4]
MRPPGPGVPLGTVALVLLPQLKRSVCPRVNSQDPSTQVLPLFWFSPRLSPLLRASASRTRFPLVPASPG